jgi:hypothetical protein
MCPFKAIQWSIGLGSSGMRARSAISNLPQDPFTADRHENQSLHPSASIFAGISRLAGIVHGPDVKIDLIEPFEFTYSSESPVMFVRITNTGTEPLDLCLGTDSDLQFENDPAFASDSSELAPWSRRFARFRNEAKGEGGKTIKPGDSIVLSQLDYCDVEFSMFHEEFRRIRPHLRVRTGVWVAGDWYERKIEEVPNLTASKSLCDFKLGSDGPEYSVVALPLKEGTWLYSCRLPASYAIPVANGEVDRRICRLPGGRMPTSITNDDNARRLTIRFGGGEEDVVINTRSGMPLSGSERTVPHLHLWRKLAGRPFTDSYQEMLDGMARRKAAAQGNPDSDRVQAPSKPEPSDNPGKQGDSTQEVAPGDIPD